MVAVVNVIAMAAVETVCCKEQCCSVSCLGLGGSSGLPASQFVGLQMRVVLKMMCVCPPVTIGVMAHLITIQVPLLVTKRGQQSRQFLYQLCSYLTSPWKLYTTGDADHQHCKDIISS